MLQRTEEDDAPATVRVGPHGSHKREMQMVDAHQLLSRLGLSSFTNFELFVGPMFRLADPDGGEVPAFESYVAQRTSMLWHLARDAGLSDRCQYTIEWDGTTLTVDVTPPDRPGVRYELRRLGPGQKALANRLNQAHFHVGKAPQLALGVPDCVAAVTAVVSLNHRGRVPRDSEDFDPEDPLGFLAFSETLVRGGVCDWSATGCGDLARLAGGWDGTAEELLDVARSLELT